MFATSPATPVAFVTGGARGIGLACGQWFLDHGYHVALIDIDAATLARTVGWYRAVHEGANPLECCVADLQAYTTASC